MVSAIFFFPVLTLRLAWPRGIPVEVGSNGRGNGSARCQGEAVAEAGMATKFGDACMCAWRDVQCARRRDAW
ncbi:hypothetical protein E2562_025499 [Oryza meyeriana var. granulata]|uniref:Secreted protein n=1 Tax=Oryza meyeriana var. granulata TaxID=110450 RepID=A0A6G1CIF6_9ORYZ|nr:hypothetical protein E2562_025499 [Oryza meyeriana var. granulata]